jgi:hypothetical protein
MRACAGLQTKRGDLVPFGSDFGYVLPSKANQVSAYLLIGSSFHDIHDGNHYCFVHHTFLLLFCMRKCWSCAHQSRLGGALPDLIFKQRACAIVGYLTTRAGDGHKQQFFEKTGPCFRQKTSSDYWKLLHLVYCRVHGATLI